MVYINLFLMCLYFAANTAYTNNHFTISKLSDDQAKQFTCLQYEGGQKIALAKKWRRPLKIKPNHLKFKTTPIRTTKQNIIYDIGNYVKNNIMLFLWSKNDPYIALQRNMEEVIFGNGSYDGMEERKRLTLDKKENKTAKLLHQPDGKIFRSELYQNKSGVHLPMAEFIHRGYCSLKVTKDYMQTAVNAFAILLYGDLDDISRLPSDYVLQSARTISMMKIAREKLAAMWNVVKGDQDTSEMSYESLAKYRPLFRYVNGKEMSKLNLSDVRILSYIGTHSHLDRHQVGLVASRYITLNPKWSEPRYLNLMNNLLCGVPMTFMRRVPENTFLQLSHQVFYHIHACDPLQRRFYLALMMRTQVLGKSYSWSANDVARLGLLLAEVSGHHLSSINPKAMSGITSKVMLEMLPQNLQHLSEAQLKYIGQKPLNILARKLKDYQDQLQIYGNSGGVLLAEYFYFIIPHSVVLLNKV